MPDIEQVFSQEDILQEFTDANYYGRGCKTLEEGLFYAKQRKTLQDRLSHQKRLLYVPGYWERHKANLKRHQATWRAKPGSLQKKSAYMVEYYSRPGTKEANRARMKLRSKTPQYREYQKQWKANRREANRLRLSFQEQSTA